MKAKILLGICLIFLSLAGCQKGLNNDYQSTGIITGPDMRLCACCGGWYIQIDSVTYEFDILPNNTNFDLMTQTYPLMVKLDWQLSGQLACPDKRINILRIKKE